MSAFKRVRMLGVLIVTGIFLQSSVFTTAQEISESQQSVLVFDIKLDRIMKSVESMGADLNELDAEMPMENIFESIKPTELKRVHGSLSLPENVEDLMTLGMAPELPIEFIVRIEFANADACLLMTENVESMSNEVELAGKKYWTPDDNETGVYGHRINDTTFEFGSKGYLVSGKSSFLTPALEKIWKAAPDEAVRIAGDLESAESFVSGAVEMGKQSGDPQVEAYLDLLDNLTTFSVTADYDSENLLTFVANGKDDEQAEEVKSGLDSLLMLAQMGGKMAVGPMAKDAPEAAAVAGKILDALAATQDGSVVKITIPKPDGFAEAMSQMVAAAKEDAEAASEMNDFRQAGLAILNYESANQRFPFDVAEIEGQNNDLSWRVRILPYLEQTELYEQMDLSAGPNDEANSKFADKMPKVLGSGGKLSKMIRIKSDVNGFANITDGTSNTIMLIEYPEGAPWLENKALSIDDAVALVSGLQDGEDLVVVFYDCSARTLTNQVDKETLRNLFNPADGNYIEGFFDR